MKNKFSSLFWLVAVMVILCLAACRSSQNVKEMNIPDIHTTRISAGWNGVYTGIIPSASGSGINVNITLNRDETFTLWYFYVGKSEEVFSSKGSFKWNDAGNNITLDIKDWPPHYMVGENELIQLDMNGKLITGALAENYVLNKL